MNTDELRLRAIALAAVGCVTSIAILQLIEENERLRRLVDSLGEKLAITSEHLSRVAEKDESEKLRQLVNGLVERIALQAELLSKRAEK